MTCPSEKRVIRDRTDIPHDWFGRPWAAGAYGGGWYGTSKAHGTRLFARPHSSWDWLHAGQDHARFPWEINCVGQWMLSDDEWAIHFENKSDASLFMERWWYRGESILMLTPGSAYYRNWSVSYLGSDVAEATLLRLTSDDAKMVVFRKGDEP